MTAPFAASPQIPFVEREKTKQAPLFLFANFAHAVALALRTGALLLGVVLGLPGVFTAHTTEPGWCLFSHIILSGVRPGPGRPLAPAD